MTLPEFEPFQKIPRLSRAVVVTEKIDGTNACVYVADDGSVVAGSRSRWIAPEDDNHGFARWVKEHATELRELGPGLHFGEWWGMGIQRGYGLREKRFSLFNTGRWASQNETSVARSVPIATAVPAPKCCHVVPVLHIGPFDTDVVECSVNVLRALGSYAAPGYMRPEGVVIYHTALGGYFKKTLEKDESPKSKENA